MVLIRLLNAAVDEEIVVLVIVIVELVVVIVVVVIVIIVAVAGVFVIAAVTAVIAVVVVLLFLWLLLLFLLFVSLAKDIPDQTRRNSESELPWVRSGRRKGNWLRRGKLRELNTHRRETNS